MPGPVSPFVSSSHRTRSTMTRVLPVPAPAMTTTGPSSASTMARCSGVSSMLVAAGPAACPDVAGVIGCGPQYRYSEATKGTRL